MVESLANILSDEKPAPPPEVKEPAPAPEKAPAVAAPAAAAEPPKEPARGADGKFVPKPPDAPSAAPAAPQPPAQPEMTEKEKAFLRAAQEERGKRQALEQELAKLRQPAQPAAPAEKPKAFWDDPEGALTRHREEIRAETTNTRLNTAELIARSRYPDFDEKVAEFAQLVQSTPGLAQQWIAAPDPAQFAYTTGKNHLLLKQAGSLDALTEKVRTETEATVRAKVEAEYKAKAEALEKERASLPPSLSDTRGGAGAGGKPAWNGPTPLADILK